MVWPILCGIVAALLVFVLTLKTVMGDNDESRALRKRLEGYGIDPRRFSTQCLTELIELRTRHLRLVERPIEQELQCCIDQVARELRGLCFGYPGFKKADLQEQSDRGSASPSWQVLVKHAPYRYGLRYLEQTQDFHRDADRSKQNVES